MRASTAHTATCALDIDVTWGDDAPLYSEHLAPAQPFVLSAARLHKVQGFSVCREWLGADQHELVSVDDGGVIVHAHGSDIALGIDEETCVQFGPITVRVRVVRPQPVPAQLSRRALDLKQTAWTAASFGLHILALGCMAFMPPKASSLSLDALSEDTRYMRYLTTPVVHEPELPWPATTAAQEPGSDAAQRDDEGQAGRLDRPREVRRTANAGDDARTAPTRPSAEQAAEVGILGVLKSAGTFTLDSPFRAEHTAAYDASAALRALMGETPGASFGLGGLGMRGTGRGGGGNADGSIGVVLETRGGTGGLGAAHGLGSRGRRERIPVLRVSDAEVRGSLSKEVIRRVIHRHLNEVRFCYQQTLSARPDLSGRVVVQFMITPSGAVQQAVVKSSTLESPDTEACIARALLRWPFPTPDGGGYVSVSYPFLFEQTGH